MATQQEGDDNQQPAGNQPRASPLVVGWRTIEQQYQRIKENAETYPYVWGSYIVVYGGFGLWFAYRWRKLRKTEDRVRGLQEKLRKLVEAENLAGSTAANNKAQTSTDKPPT